MIVLVCCQDNVRSELKTEAMLTSLLREKLYSDELEMEQLNAELAAAVRCNDILKCEVQNAMDNFSCVNHKLKDTELQVSLSTFFLFASFKSYAWGWLSFLVSSSFVDLFSPVYRFQN